MSRSAKCLVLGLVLVAGILGACTRVVILREKTLAEYDFADSRPEEVFDQRYGRDEAIHWFSEGWASHPADKGVWTLGERAALQLYLVGRECHLELSCSTHPDLAAAGQELTLLVNGHECGRFALGGEWAAAACTTTIDDAILKQGYNEVILRASRHFEVRSHPDDPRPLAIFVRSLRARALLDQDQVAAWAELNKAAEPPAGWLRAESMPVPDGSPRAGEGALPAADRRPDVLVILLDAARADHFSCYGYTRTTTPESDRLAADGVRLDRVFSVAPFTLVAVPSLLTGLPWRDHGVLKKGMALGDSFVTLPEILRDAGYLTLGYSENPLVSVATGCSQGFAEFEEVYKQPRYHEPGSNPELAERMLRRRARRGLPDGPVFVYLHLMPPHTPYCPGPEHDLWGDPDYAGPANGTSQQLHAIEERRLAVDNADRERIVSLYDGNLHRIDASLGRIVADWRALGRERELLVVVLSDHGEAFGEHGRWEHLSTVYDEMLHIPLILWPKDRWQHLASLDDRLLSITDVMPLLLSTLAVAPPADLRVPRRFSEVWANPLSRRAEIVARTTVHEHTFGIRTDRWLAIHDTFSRQELFDLRADPEARRNLRGEDPDRYRDLIKRMAAILQARIGSGEATTRELTEEELRNLRSLGYL